MEHFLGHRQHDCLLLSACKLFVARTKSEDGSEERYQKLKADASDADNEEDEEGDDDIDVADSEEEQELGKKERKVVKKPAAKKPPSKTKQPTKKKVRTPEEGNKWELDSDIMRSNSESEKPIRPIQQEEGEDGEQTESSNTIGPSTEGEESTKFGKDDQSGTRRGGQRGRDIR